MQLLQAMAERLPGSELITSGDTGTLRFEVDGCSLGARVREMPTIELRVSTIDILGFSLRLEPSGARIELPQDSSSYRGGVIAGALAAARLMLSLERHYDVSCTEPAMQALWLDLPARSALIDALTPEYGDNLLRTSGVAVGYDYHVEDGMVLIRRRTEHLIERLERAVIAGGLLAARPQRLAREWRELARRLGGTISAERWDLGGFAVTIDRAPATVLIDNVRVLPGESAGDSALRTRVRARRVGDDSDRWAIWEPRLARKQRPDRVGLDDVDDLPSPIDQFWKVEASAPPRLRDRLRPLATLLLDASPTVIATVEDEVSLWWPGLVTDLAQLAPAVDLVARLAVDLGAATGPYR